jgi:hypothetical protein
MSHRTPSQARTRRASERLVSLRCDSALEPQTTYLVGSDPRDYLATLRRPQLALQPVVIENERRIATSAQVSNIVREELRGAMPATITRRSRRAPRCPAFI